MAASVTCTTPLASAVNWQKTACWIASWLSCGSGGQGDEGGADALVDGGHPGADGGGDGGGRALDDVVGMPQGLETVVG